MPAPQRANHRAPAFARCGLRSIGSDAPAIHRQANSGQSATTPGRINSRSVFGRRLDPAIEPRDGARQEEERESHAGERVRLEHGHDDLGDFNRHGAMSFVIQLSMRRSSARQREA